MNSLYIWCYLLCILVVSYSSEESLDLPALSDELINYVNNHSETTWKAAKTNRFKTIDDVLVLLGTLFEDPTLKKIRRPTITHKDKNIKLPKSFDARRKWSNCTSIGHIRDQSKCGSCWAFGAVEAMSDRVCIHSKSYKNVQLSAKNLMSCCESCGFGCGGGFLGPSWDYWVQKGIVTGGDYDSKIGCQPYPFPPCRHYKHGDYPQCPSKQYDTPKCDHVCESYYKNVYKSDLIKGITAYNVDNNEENIMAEIMINGPVEAAFMVYEDFPNYNSGVYKHVSSKILGGHAIRILGWGIEGNVPYWLCANSWNEGWGDKGFFKILRGKNECGIEESVVAGLP